MPQTVFHLTRIICYAVLSVLFFLPYARATEELVTTDKFERPGVPTTDYVGARAYAREHNTFVAFLKLRYKSTSGDKYVSCLNAGLIRDRYVNLGIPLVAGARYGFRGGCGRPVTGIEPAFFSKVLDDYYQCDGPVDYVLEDPNDTRQKAVDFIDSLYANPYDGIIGLATGKKRSKFEETYGISLNDICAALKTSLYNRDDTGYAADRTDFSPLGNNMIQGSWKYSTRPRNITYRKTDEGYSHGLIDTTGTSTEYNWLMHMAFGKRNCNPWFNYDIRIREVESDGYYDNIQDWYKVSGLETNRYYSVTTEDLLDPDSDGCVFVFDITEARYATNDTECLNRCSTSFRMSDAASGKCEFLATSNNMLICFRLCGSVYPSIWTNNVSDFTEFNQVVRYKWYLKQTDTLPPVTPTPPEPAPPEPIPVNESEITTPQYNTNMFEIAKLTDLVFEGSEGGYTGYETKITRHNPSTGKLSIHMVWDKTERGLCQWENGEIGTKTMEYTFPYDQEFNDDRRIDVSYENFFMKLLHSLVVRDRLVKYMAQEHYSNDTHNYDPSGLDLFPVTGMWFVDHDDILRCVDEPVSNSVVVADGPTLVMDLQTLTNGTVSIGSTTGGIAEIYAENGFYGVVQTNFYPTAEGSQNKLYARFIVRKYKKIPGTKVSEFDIAPMETFKHRLDPTRVIRIKFPSGSKLYEFDFDRD